MSDPILHALQAHTKEPEEVDWEEKFYFWRGLCEVRSQEITRLKDTILRLEQRCASAEGRDQETEDKLVRCNKCDQAIYQSVFKGHRCDG